MAGKSTLPMDPTADASTQAGFLAEVSAFASVVRHLFTDGLRDGVAKCFQALPILWNLKEHRRYARVLRQPHVLPLKTLYPRLAYKYLGRSLSLDFTARTRLKILIQHYEYLAPRVRPDFLKALFDSTPAVWAQERDGQRFAIRLSFPHPDDQEGDLALGFERDGVPLYMMSFVICSGSSAGAGSRDVMFVARMQGGGARYAQIRSATQSCLDVSPADLLMSALQGVAGAMGISELVGVRSDAQVSRLDGGASQAFFDYNGFWLSYRGEKTRGGVYLMRLPFIEKPLEFVKANHRGRALRKRTFKNEVRQEVRQHCEQNFLKAGNAR